jgi:hypothetical protein
MLTASSQQSHFGESIQKRNLKVQKKFADPRGHEERGFCFAAKAARFASNATWTIVNKSNPKNSKRNCSSLLNAAEAY